MADKALDKAAHIEQAPLWVVGIDHEELFDIDTAATYRLIAQRPRQPADKRRAAKEQTPPKIAPKQQIDHHSRHQRDPNRADVVRPNGAGESADEPPISLETLAPDAPFDEPQCQKRKSQIGHFGHDLVCVVQQQRAIDCAGRPVRQIALAEHNAQHHHR